MGEPSYVLGMHIEYDQAKGYSYMKLHQKRYIISVAKRFGFEDCHPVYTPHNNTKVSMEMSGKNAGTVC